ncbi:primosomal protein N' [Candidatus Saccharibacteria bacterium RIFCSPHIGHO2_12_FULL_47_16b]|nr:MAG: primosomal protein N' [Candidatus Saccharibacteria bacterium RIFCSPHIGHO2_12_FULL_47_16b]
MHYFEVAIADKRYHSDAPLTYSHDQKLPVRSVVSVPLQKWLISGFVTREVAKPKFAVKPIKAVMSQSPIPAHNLKLAEWLADYYVCSLGEALRQFAPTKPSIRRSDKLHQTFGKSPAIQLDFVSPLTADQVKAIKAIKSGQSTTYLLHGETGSGKTRVYLELAQAVLDGGKSVILLTPEIALTTQLAAAVEQHLPHPSYILHSHLTDAERKKLWLAILEAKEPVVVIGPRSALFTPIKAVGLIVLDETHEPAYKQDQTPRYQTSRVASQLGKITGAKVVFGTATPLVTDYYLAEQHDSIVQMTKPAIGSGKIFAETEVVDIKERSNFTTYHHLSNQLIDEIKTTLSAKKQIMIYHNRRGTARLVVCANCSFNLLCPNCDIPLIYHGDEHNVRCHTCGYTATPPLVCPNCHKPELTYRTIGTKALTDRIAMLFPEARVARFDSDNPAGGRVHEMYQKLKAGEIDILVGTQLLAKGFDLPKLALVGIISAETSLSLPDFTSEERAFQLIYQVMGRVGRGHTAGYVIIQSYDPKGIIIQAAVKKDWQLFYKHILKQRQTFRFPPYSYLAQFICKRTSADSAESAGIKLRKLLLEQKYPVEIIGPAPAFYARRGVFHYWQLVLKSKDRRYLVELAKLVPTNWSIDLDPINLL